MHMGQTTGGALPFARLDGSRPDGAISADGRIIGTYCHGLLASTPLRQALLARIGVASATADHAASVEAALDELARELEAHLDIDGLIALALAERQPNLDVILIEAASELGGNHVWSFFDSDIASAHRCTTSEILSGLPAVMVTMIFAFGGGVASSLRRSSVIGGFLPAKNMGSM